MEFKLESKCYGGIGSSEKACREFTVSRESGNRSWIIVVIVMSAAVVFKLDCLNKQTCEPREIVFLALPIAVALFLIVKHLTAIQGETLLFVMPLGLQMSVVRRTGKPSITWIPWSSIRHFMILDVITGQKVIFCLAVSLDDRAGEEKTLILFRNTKPRLPDLEIIYKELQSCLDKYR